MKSYTKKHFRVQYHPAKVNHFSRNPQQPVLLSVWRQLYGKETLPPKTGGAR